MWLITPIGFFSVVQKPSDVLGQTLTVRSRVRADLENLRAQFLPGLGDIAESKTNNYRFRAVAPKAEVAAAMASMVTSLDYSNFKNQVAKVQGASRAHLYHDVWSVLYRLQAEPKKFAGAGPDPKVIGVTFHPRKDDKQRAVEIKKPSKASTFETWHQSDVVATVVPDGLMPAEVNGLPVQSWDDPPTSPSGWEELAAQHLIDEPEYVLPAGYRRAAGVVVREKNGRVWTVAPTNEFGGYKVTFPKGRVEPGMSLQATALVEAFEESGLKVRLIKHLVDIKRSQTYTRYYLAERVGGSPADMGWETQAVMLVPQVQLAKITDHPNDSTILDALSHV